MSYRTLAVDQDLFLRLKNGDQQAFCFIYEKYYQSIYSFIFSFLKQKQLSEEVLQETFLAIWNQRASIKEDYPIEPLLYLICRRKILDNFRKITATNKLRARLLSLTSELSNGTEDAIIYNDVVKFTNEAIGKLPKQQQQVLKLSRIKGLSIDEIAEELKLSRYTVKNHLAAGLKTLRLHYKHHGMYYIFLTFTGFFN